MSWRNLNRFRGNPGGPFYQTALQYAQYLWLGGLPARSMLALDRALFAVLTGTEPELKRWPLPYLAVSWQVAHPQKAAFTGNPRVHYQHLADRLRSPQYAVRKWRAWACWMLVCETNPELPGDPAHAVVPPVRSAIEKGLSRFGIPGEAALWQSTLGSAQNFAAGGSWEHDSRSA